MDDQTNNKTNTHYYDKNISREILSKIGTFPKTNKIEKFNELRYDIIKYGNLSALKYYDLIISSYVNNDGNNYDPINKIDTSDLLYIIAKNYNNDLLPILIEQLEDMKTGVCPQGRTIRLLQIIGSFL